MDPFACPLHFTTKVETLGNPHIFKRRKNLLDQQGREALPHIC
jgi:hypothetical protein